MGGLPAGGPPLGGARRFILITTILYTNKLSPKLKVTLPDKPVQYRLLAAGKFDGTTKRPMCPLVAYSAKTTIYDEGDKAQKALMWVKGEVAHPTKAGELELQIGFVEFSEIGILTVTPRDVALFEFMERDNRNVTNPYRDPSTTPVYERVDVVEKAKISAQNDADDQLFEALRTLNDLPTQERIDLAMAKGLAGSDDDIALITRALRDYAKGNPAAFVADANSPETKVRADVANALEARLLIYDAAQDSYKWEAENVELHRVAPGINNRESLCSYLLSADPKAVAALKELRKRLSKALTGK